MSITVETTQGSRIVEEYLLLGDAELANAFSKLDGNLTTLMVIAVHGSELFVGGGGGRYTVTALMDGGRSLALVGDREVTGDIPLVVGGQRIPQPLRYVVEYDRALMAASCFSKTGHLDEEEVWEEPERELVSGKVPYGGTVFSQLIQAQRVLTNDKIGNYAIGSSLEGGTTVMGRSSSGVLHAEQDVIRQAGLRGIVDLYSEREPC
jgi:hypothetical protein